MIATRMHYRDQFALVLVFDSGEYAVHYGLGMWSIFANDGEYLGNYEHCADVRFARYDGPINICNDIQEYMINTPNKMGRIK